MRRCRKEAETKESSSTLVTTSTGQRPIDELRVLVEACIRDNFAGFENPRLYSETYYGSKELVQSFVDEAEASLSFLLRTQQLDSETKHTIWKHLQTNLGRTALCLSGGAAFAYYHFGIAKALLDAGLLPQVITGTSGGALVAALLATRTDDELKKLLIPALAHRINACQDGTWTWFTRWWRTGARFDTIDWAKGCSWFTRGSMTFREAYERTGRILNVSCVPSDPHSPAILANYLTSPDCVIWSAVLASAAVPGILNPVVLMKKNSVGRLEPYSFGHKWKDGSLRTDIPLKALNLHFNVNFSIVSQVNPHINLFFFSSRGSVGRPVTHRKGRGWRGTTHSSAYYLAKLTCAVGGFLGSATEQYLKLDLTKWLKVLRHLELLPRPLGQDWSQLWLQRFSGTITIWPKSVPSDFYYILSDPSPSRLARMIHVGQLATWPKLKFVANRMKLEKLIEEGRRGTRPARQALTSVLSEDDLEALLKEAKQKNGTVQRRPERPSPSSRSTSPELLISTNVATGKPLSHTPEEMPSRSQSPSLGNKLRGWFSRRSTSSFDRLKTSSDPSPKAKAKTKNQVYQSYAPRSGSVIMEMARQSSVFFDDDDFDADSALEEDTNHGSGNGSGVDLGRDGLSEDEDDDDSGIDEASSGTEEPTADD
jgi:predicted acylesterase/phospholipase RssA